MKHEIPAGLGGNVAVDGGFADPGGRSGPGHDVQILAESPKTQPQDRSPYPTHSKIPRDPLHGESRGENLSQTTATRDCHHPENENDRDTGFSIAIAHRHPQITHARATQLRPVNWLTEEVI